MSRSTTCWPGGQRRRKGSRLGLIVASLLLAGDIRRGAAEDDSFAAGRAPPLVAYGRRISAEIYLLGGLSPSAAYVVETSEGLVLVDSGLRSDAADLKSQLA